MSDFYHNIEEDLTLGMVRGDRVLRHIQHQSARIEDLEQKLAKAVMALWKIERQPDYRLPSPQEIARTTLAELKGEDRG